MTGTGWRALDLDIRLLRVGAVLLGVGGVIGFAGVTVVGAVAASAARTWVNQLETPPSELAKQKWQQLAAASAAGAEAWKQKPSAAPPI